MKIATGGGKIKIGGLRGLVGHWTMSQDSLKSPTIIADKTPYGNDGTIYGATFVADRKGKANKAMSFDGSDDYIDCGNDESLDLTGDFSIELWIKSSSTIAGTLFNKNYISDGYFLTYLNFPDTGKVAFYAGSGDVELDSVESNLNNNTWRHLVFQVDGTTQKIYIDGTLDNSREKVSGEAEDTNFFIGSRGGTWRFFNGLIDDVHIYNRALSVEEIKLLYESYNPTLII